MKKKYIFFLVFVLIVSIFSGCNEKELNDAETNFDNEDDLSEIVTEKDTDGDGVIDKGDDFPYDPSEWKDSDMDGYGDNSDFYVNGNGGIKFTLWKYESDGSFDIDDYGIPDPSFDIEIRYIDPETGETIRVIDERTEVFYDQSMIMIPFERIIDIDDNINSISFYISCSDTDSNGIHPIDISNASSKKSIYANYFCKDGYKSFNFDGRDDGRVDELDGILTVIIEIVEIE